MPGSITGGADVLGGRLALLAPHELHVDQQETHAALTELVVPEAEHAGYVAQTEDERFIGPFNALLRVPRIAGGMGEWIGQITAFGLSQEVRETVILTVGAHWGAAFEIYAHVAGARRAGLPEEAITAIVAGRPPAGLGDAADAAQHLTDSLLADHQVPDEIYARALSAFGEDGIVALLSLIGQYHTISGILITFQVPTPEGSTRS